MRMKPRNGHKGRQASKQVSTQNDIKALPGGGCGSRRGSGGGGCRVNQHRGGAVDKHRSGGIDRR